MSTSDAFQKTWKSFPPLSLWQWLVVGLAIANFASFTLISLWLGGTAWNGVVEAGHYYLGEHGSYTEVSRSIFRYSDYHGRAMIWTHLVGAGTILFAKMEDMWSEEEAE